MTNNQETTPPHHTIKHGEQSAHNHAIASNLRHHGVNWIDWLKVVGMFFIIWGHLSPTYLKNFIYAFSVPVFFIVSGYLFRQSGWKEFIKKNTKSLVIPYFLLGLTVIVFFAAVNCYFGNYSSSYFPLSLLSIIVGSQDGLGEGSIGCQALWFVYTLFLVKMIANAVGSRWYLHTLISVIFLYMAQWLVQTGLNLHSSFANVLVAYPFFAIGYYIKTKWSKGIAMEAESAIQAKTTKLIPPLIIGLLIISFGSYLNGMIEMYNARFGFDLFVFLIDGLVGTGTIALLCMKFGHRDWRGIVTTLSRGSILVLAWQIVFLVVIKLLLYEQLGTMLYNDFITFVIAFIVYLFFIPIIKLISKYCPILIGYRH